MYGQDWLTSGEAPLKQDANHAVQTIVDVADIQPSHDDLVAELKFSFWVGLLATRYDSTLWRSALYKGFLSTGGMKRSDVHKRMNAIRRFRNRVAHHEPIYDRSRQMHDEAVEATKWMCRDTGEWLEDISNFSEVYVP